MINFNAVLVQDWLLKEVAAYGLLEQRANEFVFLGEKHDFLIEVKATPIKKHYQRLREPAPDFGPDYD